MLYQAYRLEVGVECQQILQLKEMQLREQASERQVKNDTCMFPSSCVLFYYYYYYTTVEYVYYNYFIFFLYYQSSSYDDY